MRLSLSKQPIPGSNEEEGAPALLSTGEGSESQHQGIATPNVSGMGHEDNALVPALVLH